MKLNKINASASAKPVQCILSFILTVQLFKNCMGRKKVSRSQWWQRNTVERASRVLVYFTQQAQIKTGEISKRRFVHSTKLYDDKARRFHCFCGSLFYLNEHCEHRNSTWNGTQLEHNTLHFVDLTNLKTGTWHNHTTQCKSKDTPQKQWKCHASSWSCSVRRIRYLTQFFLEKKALAWALVL